MGNNQCQCVNLMQDMQAQSLQEATAMYRRGEMQQSEYKLMLKIVKIQANVRSFLVRRRMQLILRRHDEDQEEYNQKVDRMLAKFIQANLAALQTQSFLWGEYPDNDMAYRSRSYRDAALQDNGSVYIGEVTRTPPHHKQGKGIQIWQDGSVYLGFWRNGQSNGNGRLIHVNGDVYEGNWVDHKCNGMGVYKHNDGAVYSGLWKEDKQHGTGTEKWPDGSSYQGDYVQGQKQGKGVFTWPDGSTYSGAFRDNHINGQGVYQWPDGRSYQGGWEDNQMHGQGVFTRADGTKYVGAFRQDKKEGTGALLWTDGRQYYGHFQDNKQHGKGIMISQNGVKKYGEWLNGDRERWLIFSNDSTFDQLEHFMKDVQARHSRNNATGMQALPEDIQTKVHMQESRVPRSSDRQRQSPSFGL